MALVFNLFLGLTLSTTDYSKSINFEYESLRPASYGMELSLDIDKNYFVEFDLKRLAANVQSSSGNLNVFGWDYTHDIAMLKFGYAINENHSVYASPVAYYVPLLFPIQVGALTSTAAFEKTPAYGFGVGYKHKQTLEKISINFDASFSYLNFASSDYDTKYSYLFDLDVHPTYEINKKMTVGVNYNLVTGLSSLKENKTGSNFPFKTSYFLHNLFLTFAYTLH